MIHLYGFTHKGAPVPPVRGLDEQPLLAVEVGGVAAVVSRHAALDRAPTRAAAIRHGEVVEALRAEDAVLPVRFGERFATTDGLVAATSRLAPAIVDRLQQLRGCVELGVRVTGADLSLAAAADGTSYLRERAAALARRDELFDRLHRRLERLACASVVSPGDSFVASYLVRADAQAAFTTCVSEFGADNPQLTVVCTGPWAPYSFATFEAAV